MSEVVEIITGLALAGEFAIVALTTAGLLWIAYLALRRWKDRSMKRFLGAVVVAIALAAMAQVVEAKGVHTLADTAYCSFAFWDWMCWAFGF